MPYAKVILKSGKEHSIFRFHPWIFSGAIKNINGEVKEGDIVKVYDNQNNFLAIGHYQIGSITIRIFSFKDIDPDYNFWKSKIENAYLYRTQMGLFNLNNTNVFRFIHAEGDGMPGLVIDYYNGTAVIQTHSIGMFMMKDILVKALQEVLGDKLKAVYDKSNSTLPHNANIEQTDQLIWGENVTNLVEENGFKFKVDWVKGQKTGFFIDQRENRKLLEYYAKDKSVLNMFGYTGGFSVYAIAGGANNVHTVDASKLAIDVTNENVALNFTNANHEGFAVDAFEFLKNADNKYDIIILDPPAFAKHINVLDNALKGYKRLNQIAIEKIKPGGLIFTFSCSQVVTKENFRKSVFAASANSKRNVRILHQLTQPIDHPVSIYHPESEYLKGLVLHVE